jgi:hypothetical protein
MGPTGAAIEKPKTNPLMKKLSYMPVNVYQPGRHCHGQSTIYRGADLKKQGNSIHEPSGR